MHSPPLVSVVVPSCNEGEKLEMTVRSLLDGCSSSLEIIVVDNGSNDGSTDFLQGAAWRGAAVQLQSHRHRLGVANARNAGARAASGHMLMFSDAHVLLPEAWDVPLLAALEDSAAGIVSPLLTGWPGQDCTPCSGQRWQGPLFHAFEWLAPTSTEPHVVPLLCGALQAFRRETFEDFGGYDSGMVNWGMEDQEICMRYWLLGLEVRSVPAVTVRHYFRGTHIYPVSWYHVLHNDLRAVYAHFGPDRVSRVVAALAHYEGFSQAVADVQASDIWDRRVALDARRVHSDDWFMDRFGMIV